MAQSKTVTRYGTRYGRTIRERLAKAEEGYKGKQKCPYCSYTNVKRQAAGIWSCSKCKSTFTGRAFQLRKPVPVTSKAQGDDDV